jgi:catechol 1,2-dioxygenase
MHIMGEGKQDLITQIYFSGDSYIQNDLSASAPTAKNRILTITSNSQREKQLRFNVIMAKEFIPEDNVFKKLSGLYKMNDKSMMVFYRDGDLLFMKWNGQIREALSYKGNNKFSGSIDNATTAEFELLPDKDVKVVVHYNAPALRREFNIEGGKSFKY